MADNLASLKIEIQSGDIKKASDELNKLGGVAGKTEKSTNMLTSSFASLSTLLGTVGVAALAREFVKIADDMKLLDARLKMVSASTVEYISQKKELLSISKQTYSSIADITTLYTKLDPALKSLGATTKDVNNITASFSKGLKLGGASAQEAASATLQFAQAMGSGVLRGEEFNAIAEASPKLMKYLAEGLGVPQTALRKMAMEGELSAGRVSAALLKMTTQINDDFTQIPLTVGMATTNLKTDLMTSIEEFDKTTGATKALAETIAGLSVDLSQYGTDITTFFVSTSKFIKDHNDALKTTVALVGGVATAYYGFIAGGVIVTGLRNITTAVYALRTAMVALQASSPILLGISVALGVATAAYLAHDDALEKKNYSTIDSIDALTKAHDDLLKKRKEITSDKFALDKTQKKETAIVDDELKKIENRLNAIGTAKSNNIDKAKKEAEELAKSAKILEENAKKLAPPEKAKKEKKAVKSEEQKEAERLAKEEAEQERKLDHDLNQSKLSNISKLTLARQESEVDVENSSIQADTTNQLRKQALIDSWRTELENLNTSVVDEYDFVSKMFPEGIPEEWFKKINDKFKDLKETTIDTFKIEFDTEGLEGLPKAISAVGKAMSNLAKEDKKYQENKAKYQEGTDEFNQNEAEHTTSQIKGYSNLAGAMSNMFEQGSQEAQAMQAVQAGLALVEATLAVVHAGTSGDVYTAIPRMIATAAMVGTALSNIGESYNGGSASTIATIPNSGTVLGDSTAVSQSTENVTKMLEDIHASEYTELRSINRAVTSMNKSIENTVTALFKAGGINVTGSYGGAVNEINSVDKHFASKNSLLQGLIPSSLPYSEQLVQYGKAASAASGIIIAEKIASYASKALFGKGETFSGIIARTLSSQAITAGQARTGTGSNAYFSNLAMTQTDGGYLGSDSTTFYRANSEASSELVNSVNLIYKSVSDILYSLDEGLGSTNTALIDSYKLATLSIETIGKTGEEIGKAFSDQYSAGLDRAVSDIFGSMLSSYQKLGESLYDTASRLMIEQAVVVQTFGDIGKSIIGNTMNISDAFAEASGGIQNFIDISEEYYDQYFTDAEKTINTQKHLAESFNEINIAMPTTLEGFRSLVSSAGPELYAELMQLSSAFYAVSSAASEAAKASINNMNSFMNSLMTASQIANNMALLLNTNVATSVSGLSDLYVKLATDADGLTDAELQLLEANKGLLDAQFEEQKALAKNTDAEEARIKKLNESMAKTSEAISRLNSAFNSIKGTVESLRGASKTSEQSIQDFYNAVKLAKDTYNKKDYEAFNDVLSTVSKTSSSLMDTSAFKSLEEMQFSQLLAANQLEDLGDLTMTEIDYLEGIEENTRKQISQLEKLVGSIGESVDAAMGSSIDAELLKLIQEKMANVTVNESKSNEDLIKEAYQVVLGREAESQGLSWWTSQVDSGLLKKEDIQVEIGKSAAAYVEQFVKDLYYSSGGVLSEQVLDTSAINAIDYLRSYGIAGFSSGGYTGDMPTNSIAGVVHGKEYVVNAQTTKDLGLNNSGGVFKSMANELQSMKNLMVKLVADNSKILQVDRAMLSYQEGVA